MYSILLVDDDAIMRIGVKTMLRGSGDFYIAGEAENGCAALELCRRLSPDIVITDMKMPVMDGVALIRELQPLPAPPAVLALSGYDDYDLVRRALKYGAQDYLLKLNLSPAVLLNALQEIVPEEEASSSADHHAALEKSRLMSDIIAHFYVDPQVFTQELSKAGLTFEGSFAVVFLVKIGESVCFDEMSEDEYHTLRFSVTNIIEEILSEQFSCHSAESKTGEFYFLFTTSVCQDAALLREILQETADRIYEMLEEYLALQCRIGIGLQSIGGPAVEALSDACKKASDALRLRFHTDAHAIFPEESDTPAAIPPHSEDALFSAKTQLFSALKNLNTAQLTHAFEAVLEVIRASCTGMENLSIAFEIYAVIGDYCSLCNLDIQHILPQSCKPINDFHMLSSTICLFSWLTLLEQDLRSYIEGENDKGYNTTIQRVQQIIQSRYSEDIALPEIASQLGFTSGYLSTLMKKYTGMTFLEYLTEVRIRAAKEMLLQTTRKIYDIAQEVGYPDQFYFSRTFKRSVGVSPAEFRKKGGAR